MLRRAGSEEHCSAADSWRWFACRGNQTKESRAPEWTTPRMEWHFVLDPASEGWRQATTQQSEEGEGLMFEAPPSPEPLAGVHQG